MTEQEQDSIKSIAMFGSTHATIRAERLCKKHNIDCQAIPVPRTISLGCGIALQISNNDLALACKLFVEENLYVVIRDNP